MVGREGKGRRGEREKKHAKIETHTQYYTSTQY
jgi:hypothetical protein